MAFTITYDGTGIVAYADGLTDTSGGSWSELGGGAISSNPDVYLYGSASIGSKYASKTGYTYIDGITALNYGSGGGAEGEYLYVLVNILAPGPLDILANDPFNIVMGATTGTLREYVVASESESNGWTGGWKAFVVDPSITSTLGSGNAITAVDTIGIWIDTNTSVRAESIFQSMIISAKGITFTGTPTVSAEGWDELTDWCIDYTNRAFPFLEKRGSTYFMKGSVTVGNGSTATTFSAEGNNIECEETSFYNGTAWVSTMPATANSITTTANSSIDWTNVSIAGYTDNKLSIDTSTGNASSFVGGTIKILSTLVGKATDSYSGVVIGQYDARTLGAEEYTTCTFDGSATMTVGATANFTNDNIINGTSSVTSTSTTDLSYVGSNTFNSSGSNHAVELTSIGAGSMNWTCVTTSFDSGTAASPVTPTSTGNEDIYVNVTTASDLTINVGEGATTPSIRVGAGFTGDVNVVAGVKTLTMTDIPEGTQVTLVNSSTRVELQNSSAPANGIITYTHSGGETIDILLMSLTIDPNVSDIFDLTLPNANSSIKFQTLSDPNFSNPS